MRIKFKVESKIDADKIIEKQKKVLFDSMLKMQELAITKVPTDQGMLANSIQLFPMTKGSTEYILAARSSYAQAVEYGSSPHFVPIEPLKGWASRKLGDQSLAWAVRQKIAKYGTKAHPFFRPAFDEVKNIWVSRYNAEEMGEK